MYYECRKHVLFSYQCASPRTNTLVLRRLKVRLVKWLDDIANIPWKARGIPSLLRWTTFDDARKADSHGGRNGRRRRNVYRDEEGSKEGAHKG